MNEKRMINKVLTSLDKIWENCNKLPRSQNNKESDFIAGEQSKLADIFVEGVVSGTL